MKPQLLIVCIVVFLAASCSNPPANTAPNATASKAPAPIPEWKSGYRVFVTNETSGDLSIIDGTTLEVIGTVKLGKRPRGIHASPDQKTIYVALSGSPLAPPGVDESKLPPPDKSADGIGVYDVELNKIVKVLPGGSDPENFAISLDGKTMFISNEDAAGISFVDLSTGKLGITIKTGEEPEGVTLSPDGKKVYSTSENDGTVSVIDVATQKLVKNIKVGGRPRNVVFLPDGKHAYVNAETAGSIALLDTVKNEKMKDIQLGTAGEIKPMGLALEIGRAHV